MKMWILVIPTYYQNKPYPDLNMSSSLPPNGWRYLLVGGTR